MNLDIGGLIVLFVALIVAVGLQLAALFGINVRTKKFWEDSLAIIGKRIERYCEL